MQQAARSGPAAPRARRPASAWRYPAAVLLVLLVVGAAVALIVALGGGHKQPGFLGTNASRAADVNLLLHSVMVLAILVGAHLAHVGDIPAHRINQTIVVLANLVSIASVMLVSLFRVVLP